MGGRITRMINVIPNGTSLDLPEMRQLCNSPPSRGGVLVTLFEPCRERQTTWQWIVTGIICELIFVIYFV
jgi:hypothetical protein